MREMQLWSKQANIQWRPSSREINSLEKVRPGIKPLFFNQKIEQKEPEKKIPSTAANARATSPAQHLAAMALGTPTKSQQLILLQNIVHTRSFWRNFDVVRLPHRLLLRQSQLQRHRLPRTTTQATAMTQNPLICQLWGLPRRRRANTWTMRWS